MLEKRPVLVDHYNSQGFSLMVVDHPRSENKVTITFERTATQDLFNSKKENNYNSLV